MTAAAMLLLPPGGPLRPLRPLLWLASYRVDLRRRLRRWRALLRRSGGDPLSAGAAYAAWLRTRRAPLWRRILQNGEGGSGAGRACAEAAVGGPGPAPGGGQP